ncbi:MAG: hypothetical protein RR993_01530 [Clostridia bacterium]
MLNKRAVGKQKRVDACQTKTKKQKVILPKIPKRPLAKQAVSFIIPSRHSQRQAIAPQSAESAKANTSFFFAPQIYNTSSPANIPIKNIKINSKSCIVNYILAEWLICSVKMAQIKYIVANV